MSSNEPPRSDDPYGSARSDSPEGSGAPPNYPQAPPVHADETSGQPGGSVDQPPSMSLAVRLMLLGAVVSLVGIVVNLLSADSVKAQVRGQMEQSGQQISQETLDSLTSVAITVGVVAGLFTIGLWLWMAWKNGQGRGWARIVATVLAGINVLFTVLSLTSGNVAPVASILSVVNLILAIVIVVLLWRKESSAFYAAT